METRLPSYNLQGEQACFFVLNSYTLSMSMTARVNLHDLAQELQIQTDGWNGFLHKPTGEFVGLQDEALSAAEEGTSDEEFADWEQEEIELAKRIIETDEYIALPSKWDIHEYNMMEDFCLAIENEKMRDVFLHAIRGKGAFRRFRDLAERAGVMKNWFEFRDEAYEEFAKEWCEKNDIPYTNEPRKEGEEL
jgi:hypothetical protein